MLRCLITLVALDEAFILLMLRCLIVLHLTLLPSRQDRSLVLALEECFFIAITRVIRPL